MESAVRHLYIHIPFCPSKCEYCAFVTHVGSLKLAVPYVDAVCREAEMRRRERRGGPLSTVYLGGGTPSMLAPAQIEQLLRVVRALFGWEKGAEITMECHPTTVSEERLRGYRDAGVTRVSFGAESMRPGELAGLGRHHTARDVRRAVRLARSAGMTSVALDLMYGIPLQTERSWRRTLADAVECGVDHLSLYPLQLEPRTVFARRARRGELALPADESMVGMYEIACRFLRESGFDHYEVSSWARHGHRCLHNLAYWRNAEYYGLGAGAHSYLDPHRTENVPNTGRYIRQVLAGGDPTVGREQISREARVGETMVLGLRLLLEGPDLVRVEGDLGRSPLEAFAAEIAEMTGSGLLRMAPGRLTLAERAVPIANEVWERFLAPA